MGGDVSDGARESGDEEREKLSFAMLTRKY